MQTVSLGDLRAAVSDRADLPTTLSTTTAITLAQMDRWINQSGRALMELLIEAYGEGHWETTQELTVTPDQDYSALPTGSPLQDSIETDIFRVLFLRVTLDGTRIAINRAEADLIDTEDSNDTVAWTLAFPPRWQFREYLDQRFIWSRTPTEAHVVKIHYVPYFVFIDTSSEPALTAEMSDATDHHMRAHMGWDEWVVLDCAIKAMKRQDQPAETWQALLIEQQAVEKKIRSSAPKRTDNPKKIRKRFHLQDQQRRSWWLPW